MFFCNSKKIKLQKIFRKPDLVDSDAFLERLIEYLPNMVFVKDAKELRFVRFNKAGEDLLGYERSDLIGKNDYDFFPKEQADFFTEKDRAVLAGKVIVDIPEEPIQTKNQGLRILHTRKIPIFGPDGMPEYLLGVSEDITDRKKAEEERVNLIREQAAAEERELSNKRTQFLAEASALLVSTLDYHVSLRELAKLSVPLLADGCTVALQTEEGKYDRVAAVCNNPEKEHLIEELNKYFPVHSDPALSMSGVINTDKTLFVPITARGKILGAVSFVLDEPSRKYTTQDVAFFEELGRRVGIAIDNAMLFESAQKAIRSRDEFLSIASHELKTPITALKLQLQIARKNTNPVEKTSPTPEKLAKMLDVSTIQVNRLTTLIDDLLDVTRIEAGKLSFQFELLDITKLVREMVDCYAEHFKAASCPVTLHLPNTILISADRFRMEQVVLNLLSNAAKYGAGKPIIVIVESKGELVRISVQDFGMGVPADKHDKIFERFERAVSPNNISGLGLGLYITRKIVSAHHGKVFVESELGKGSLFMVEIPGAHELGLAGSS